MPEFVKDEFDAYLECGILAHGFLRLRCGVCAHERLVAFSCKRRGFCPSCGARRMAETAARLVDQIIPRVPVRQWVLSFPIPLRILCAAHPGLLTPLLRIVHRVITGFLLEQAGLKRSAAHTGAVTLIQRFGSAGNLDIHLHCLVLDGVHRCTEGEPLFDEARAPSGDDLEGLLDKLIARVMKMLTRKGYLLKEQGITYLADIDADNPLASLQAPSCTYRIALGPRAGQKVLSLRTLISQQKRHTAVLCADAHGFSLHVAVAAHQRKERERLCRYMPDAAQQTSEPAQDQDHAHGQSARMSWARLLRRVFDIDVAHCVCGGALKIIAAIEDPVVIARILTHLGLPARAPPRSPARSAPRTHAA